MTAMAITEGKVDGFQSSIEHELTSINKSEMCHDPFNA
jgi:hypothetical protein